MSKLNVTLREFRPGDEEALTRIHNQRSVARDTLQIPFTTEQERRERFQMSPTNRWIIAEVDGQVVGMASLTLGTRRRAHAGSLGMGIDEAFHGQGIGTMLMSALIDLADNWYNLRRLELEVYTSNAPAIRLYQRFGFEIEGTLRAYAWRDGAYADVYAMARLHDEPPITRRTPDGES